MAKRSKRKVGHTPPATEPVQCVAEHCPDFPFYSVPIAHGGVLLLCYRHRRAALLDAMRAVTWQQLEEEVIEPLLERQREVNEKLWGRA